MGKWEICRWCLKNPPCVVFVINFFSGRRIKRKLSIEICNSCREMIAEMIERENIQKENKMIKKVKGDKPY